MLIGLSLPLIALISKFKNSKSLFISSNNFNFPILRNTPPNTVLVYLGLNDRQYTQSWTQMRNVSKIIIHPSYTDFTLYDIALLKLYVIIKNFTLKIF